MEKTVTVLRQDLNEIRKAVKMVAGEIQMNNLENAKKRLAGILEKIQEISDRT